MESDNTELLKIDPMINHYIVLGKLTVSFSKLEAIINFFIQVLIKTDTITAGIVTAPLSFKNSVNVLVSIYQNRVLNNEKIEKLKLVLRNAIDVESERNKYVHSFWNYDIKTDSAVRVKSTVSHKDGFKISLEPTDHAIINELCIKIDTVTGELSMIFQEHLTELGQPNQSLKLTWQPPAL